MLYESAIAEAQFPLLRDLPATPSPSIPPLRAGWVLGKVALAGLLLMYLVGWAQDFERVRRLQAEPVPQFTVISKYQAWERIYRFAPRKAASSPTLLGLTR
ncbi:MAG TPA: hypothetical protein VLT62_30815 [Candidatus Methylomirabilis sp.]|nr:hypothetical protein [Candidatus Methylomirabilis sp.]